MTLARDVCLSFVAAAVALSSGSASAQVAPPPMWQLDYPVLAVGERGQMRIQIPASSGLANHETYYVLGVSNDEEKIDSGYRFVVLSCPPGFQSAHFGDGDMVLCGLMRPVPRPAGEMVVEITNVRGADGETVMRNGFMSVYGGVKPNTTSPWRAYGIR